MSLSQLKKGDKVPFTQIANAALTDRALSLKAKGLLAYMLSKPDNWQFYVKVMASELKEGKDTVAKILRELISNEYVKREQLRHGGKLRGYQYTVYQSPYPKSSYPKSSDRVSSDNSNTDPSNTDPSNTDDGRPPVDTPSLPQYEKDWIVVEGRRCTRRNFEEATQVFGEDLAREAIAKTDDRWNDAAAGALRFLRQDEGQAV